MCMWLRHATDSQEILLGTFVDDTDGKTPETGLTIANTDIKLWKEGASSEVSKNSGGATHVAGGRFHAVLDSTDTNTLGKLEINVHVPGALPVRREFLVVPAMVYDSVVLGSDRFDVNVTHIADTAQTGRDIGASVLLSPGTGTGQVSLSGGKIAATIASGDIANGAIASSTFASGALDAVWSTSSRTLTSFGSLVADVATAVWSATTRTLTAFGHKVQLADDEREAVAVAVESHLLDEGDSQMLINAIVGAIGNQNVDEVALVAAIRADLERNGGNLHTLLSRIVGTLAAGTHQPQSGDAYAVVSDETNGNAALQSLIGAQPSAEQIRQEIDAHSTALGAIALGVAAIPTSNPSAADIRAEIDSNSTVLDQIRKVVEADVVVDTGTSPWELVFIERGTGGLGVGTELFRKALTDVAGSGVTSTTTVIGGAMQT